MPLTPELTTSELAVLESLQSATESVSQRELARRSGLSVGLVNAVLKKLVHTGYVKTSRLDRRSIEYLLTPQGFAQTALRSYHYIINTVRAFRNMQSRLHTVMQTLKQEGCSEYWLAGDGDLAELVATFFEDEGMGPLNRGVPHLKGLQQGVVILNAEPKVLKIQGARVVDLLQEFHASQEEGVVPKKSAPAQAQETEVKPKRSKKSGSTAAVDRFTSIDEFYGSSHRGIHEDIE